MNPAVARDTASPRMAERGADDGARGYIGTTSWMARAAMLVLGSHDITIVIESFSVPESLPVTAGVEMSADFWPSEGPALWH